MDHGVAVSVVIPESVQAKIKGLDVATLLDKIDLEADFSGVATATKTIDEEGTDDFAL